MQEALVSLKIYGAVTYFKRCLSPFGDLRKLQFLRKGNQSHLISLLFFFLLVVLRQVSGTSRLTLSWLSCHQLLRPTI